MTFTPSQSTDTVVPMESVGTSENKHRHIDSIGTTDTEVSSLVTLNEEVQSTDTFNLLY